MTGDDTRADWRDAVWEGCDAPSWAAADAARAHGATGLIEASRHAPAEWHLVLFRWNDPGGASVVIEGRQQGMAG